MIAATRTTICAIATAPGGALGIVRVSGPDTFPCVSTIFYPRNPGHILAERPSHTVTFGEIRTPEGELIDEVLITTFRAPHSYTGEDAMEISCHGSSYILQRVIELLIRQGCTLAAPGEYTQRAFLNGRMDLCQAEGVADLIAARSATMHRQAINQMRGGISEKIKELRAKLIHIASLIELELDFGDHEDIQLAGHDEILQTSSSVKASIAQLIKSFQIGNAIKNGIPVAIIGQTNAGKSTLLNTLLQEDKAIVSQIHGTTRDIIEDTMNIDGMTYRFIDTAGIRETSDDIEKMGIERSFNAIKKSKIILVVHDIHQTTHYLRQLLDTVSPFTTDKQLILVLNKIDTPSPTPITEQMPLPIEHQIGISAQKGTNIDKLKQLIVHLSAPYKSTAEDVIITNVRHYEALSNAFAALQRVEDGITQQIPSDLIAQDFREIIYHLSDIIGEVTTDDILQNVFRHFCVGK